MKHKCGTKLKAMSYSASKNEKGRWVHHSKVVPNHLYCPKCDIIVRLMEE